MLSFQERLKETGMRYWWGASVSLFIFTLNLQILFNHWLCQKKERKEIIQRSKIEQQERERTIVKSLAVLLTMSWSKKRKLFRYYVLTQPVDQDTDTFALRARYHSPKAKAIHMNTCYQYEKSNQAVPSKLQTDTPHLVDPLY